MQRAHRRHMLLVSAVAACVGVGAVLVYANVEEDRAQRSIDLSNASEAAISHFRVSMNRASASMAAYTVTGSEDLAADARSSRAAAVVEANRIRDLVAAIPSQRERMRQMDERMAERAGIETAVLDAVRNGGRESGQAALLTSLWMANRLALRTVTDEMLQEEQARIAGQETRLARVRMLTTWGIVGLLGLLLASFLATVAYSRADESTRAKAMDEIRASEARLDLAARSGSMGLWELDLTTGKAWRTLRHDQIFGYDELQPTWGSEEALRQVLPEDRPIFQRAFETAMATGQFYYQLRIQPARRSVRWIEARGEVYRDADGKPVRMAGVVQDVTQRHEMQEHLEVTAHLSALGTLVAGLAHEINTPLATEIASEGFALEALKQMESRLHSGEPVDRETLEREMTEIASALGDARASGDRIARIVKDLSTLGRKDAPRTRVELRKVVDRALRWLPVSISRGAAIQVVDGSPRDVLGTEGQLSQVIVNLVTNAAKAIPAERRGNVTIRIGEGSPGTSRIDVSDDGVGMTPEVMKRVFDPFFTTRKAGEGTGLGLAISHAIVRAHGGTISVTSEVGKGSTFQVELPAAPGDVTS